MFSKPKSPQEACEKAIANWFQHLGINLDIENEDNRILVNVLTEETMGIFEGIFSSETPKEDLSSVTRPLRDSNKQLIDALYDLRFRAQREQKAVGIYCPLSAYIIRRVTDVLGDDPEI